MTRRADYESEGQRFESSRAHHTNQILPVSSTAIDASVPAVVRILCPTATGVAPSASGVSTPSSVATAARRWSGARWLYLLDIATVRCPSAS